MPYLQHITIFTASYFTFTSRYIHNTVLFPFCLTLFIPSGVISLLFSSNLLNISQPGEFIFQCYIFLPFFFFIVHGVLKARTLSGLSFPSPVGPILSELSTIIHLSLVGLHSMAHSFIELDKGVVHVIILVGFL